VVGNSAAEAQRDAAKKIGSAFVLPDFRMNTEASVHTDLVDRPLFSPTRTRAPTQIVTAAPESAKPTIRRGLYQLTGVTDLGLIKIAYLREVATNRVRSVREGDSLQELTVKTITPTQLTLTYAGDIDLIELAKFTPSGRVPVPMPPLAAALTPPPPSSPPPQSPPVSTSVVARAPASNGTLPTGADAAASATIVQPSAPTVAESRAQAILRQETERAWGGKM